MDKIRSISVSFVVIFFVMAVSCLVACMPSDKDMKEEVEKLNSEFPQKLGNGMTLEHIDFDSSGFVYVVKCDEDSIDIKMIEENKEDIKNTMTDMLLKYSKKDNEVGALVEYCKKADKTVSYKFIGNSSPQEVIITTDPSEM